MLLYISPINLLIHLGEARIGYEHFFGLVVVPYSNLPKKYHSTVVEDDRSLVEDLPHTDF